jgi:Dna[CI] antecedent, DciA
VDSVGGDIRKELARFGPGAAIADLVERWPEAVGEAIARNAWPARVARDGTLHVATADSVCAFELGHRAREIAAAVGVESVRFTPGPLPGDATPSPPFTATEPGAAEVERAAQLASSIGDDELRKTVQRAIGLGLARAAADR